MRLRAKADMPSSTESDTKTILDEVDVILVFLISQVFPISEKEIHWCKRIHVV